MVEVQERQPETHNAPEGLSLEHSHFLPPSTGQSKLHGQSQHQWGGEVSLPLVGGTTKSHDKGSGHQEARRTENSNTICPNIQQMPAIRRQMFELSSLNTASCA